MPFPCTLPDTPGPEEPTRPPGGPPMRRAALALALLLAAAPGRAEDTKDVTRVACVGDSITASSGYPEALQKLLGPKYRVRNFGVSGRALLAKGDYPYAKEQAYKDALAFTPHV